MNQSELIYNYSRDTRESFNEDLLFFDDNKTIDQVIKIIRSCERTGAFTIKLLGYFIVDDPRYIDQHLRIYSNFTKRKSSRKNKDNEYDYIKLKDTDIILIVVRYFIEASDGSKEIRVPIAIPKTMNKFYYKIDGIWYYSMYQIVDGSTYNNSGTSSSKTGTITLKTVFMPIKMYRYTKDLKTLRNGKKNAIVYNTKIFSKFSLGMNYILAKAGLMKGLIYMGFSECVFFTQTAPEDEDLYIFEVGNKFYISTPKMIYDKEHCLQSMIYTLVKSINRNVLYEEIFKPDFWFKVLGYEFSAQYNAEKGMGVCKSIESLYDINTKETINLPFEDRSDIYAILRWMFREFPNLKVKDNLNIRAKKIRKGAYIASIYASKLSKGIHRLSKQRRNLKLINIEQVLRIHPMHIVKGTIKTKLVTYRNCVNDLDTFTALKYTFKGPSGIGDNKASAVSDNNKQLDPSTIGLLDANSSSNSDPGLSGMLVPYVKVDEYGYLGSDFKEPNEWESNFKDLVNSYNELKGMEEVIKFKRTLTGKYDEEYHKEIKKSIKTIKKLSEPMYEVDNTSEDVVILTQPFFTVKEDINHE